MASFDRHLPEDARFMAAALDLARRAQQTGEVPVGAVVVRNGEIIGQGSNSVIAMSDPAAHAEIVALRLAAARLENYRLDDADLYVTLEPCVMCAGALVHARIRRLIFGCRDLRYGGVRSKFRLADSEILNHRVSVVEGILAVECVEILKDFFDAKRVARPDDDVR